MKNLQFVNVYSDSYELYEYCKEQGYCSCDYDEFIESGADLQFYEGDPDMIKIDGETGYFALCGNKVFYYIDDFYSDKAEGILRDFFKSGSMANCGYYSKFIPGKKSMTIDDCRPNENLWDAYNRLRTAIAYRGGAGYVYNIIPLRTAA